MTHPLPAPLQHHRRDDLVATGAQPRTAAQLLADARAIAAHLPSTARGAELVLVCHDRYLFAASMLAAWERGFVIALPPNAQPEMIRTLRRSGSVATVVHDHDAISLGIDVRGIVDIGARSNDLLAQPAPMPPERPIVIVYTSGTTGTPMPCPKTAGQLLGEAHTLARTFGLGPTDRVLATVPPHHIYGLLFGVLVPLVSGASFTRETVLHGEPLLALAHRDRARVLVSVPAHLRALRVLEPGSFPPLDRIFSSGAALPAETAHDLRARFGWAITEVLGSSETGGIAWRTDPDAPWSCFDGVSVHEGDGGRMLLDSPLLAPGSPRPYVAGDRIAAIDAHSFRHLGRADGVLKVGSTRVSIAELEHRLLAIPGVEDAAALAIEVGGARGWESWAVVATRTLSPSQIHEALVPWLDAVVIPRRIRVVDALPREDNGKLSQTKLRALFDKK